MTENQIELAKALGALSYCPGTAQKRFARNMASAAEHRPELPISEAQDRYMRCLAWRFRRQLPDRFVPSEKPQ